MNNIILQMLKNYEIKSTQDEINALKEVIQKIILSGLYRGGFFEVAFCCWGSLNYGRAYRFSEDLNFALIKPNLKFNLNKYFKYVKNELKAYGLNLEISANENDGDVLEYIFRFLSNDVEHEYNHTLKDISIRFEVDINPPMGATCEISYSSLPRPYQIRLYDRNSLFACNVYAILYHDWKTKNMDLYDYIFFLHSSANVNIELIKNKLIRSNYIDPNSEFDINVLKELLINKFNEIDYTVSKEDILPFIKYSEDTDSLNLGIKKYFISITEKLS